MGSRAGAITVLALAFKPTKSYPSVTMMLLTTAGLACLVLALLWLFPLRLFARPWAGYLVVVAVGILFMLSGSVHLIYVGVEVAALGCLLVWFDPARKHRRRVA